MSQSGPDVEPGERPEPVEQAHGQGLDAAAVEVEPRETAQPGQVAGRDRGEPAELERPGHPRQVRLRHLRAVGRRRHCRHDGIAHRGRAVADAAGQRQRGVDLPADVPPGGKGPGRGRAVRDRRDPGAVQPQRIGIKQDAVVVLQAGRHREGEDQLRRPGPAHIRGVVFVVVVLGRVLDRQPDRRRAAHAHRLGIRHLDLDGLAETVGIPDRRAGDDRDIGRVGPVARRRHLEDLREAVETARATYITKMGGKRSHGGGHYGYHGGVGRGDSQIMVCGCRPVRTAARKNLDAAAGYPVAALVLQVRVVPAVVVEIRVVVGDLVAVQPVDLHTGPGGAGVVPGVRGIRAAHRPETVLVGPDRRMPRRRPVLHEAVVVGDVRRGCVARGRGHEQQPELAARAHPGRGERPVVRHPDLVRAGRRRHQRQCRRRIRLVPRLRPQRRMAQACYGPVVGRPDRPAVERNPPAARPPAAERDPVGVEVASLHGVVEIQHIRRRADRPRINRPAPNPADIQHDVRPPGHKHRLAHRKAHRHGLPGPVGRTARRRRRNRRRRCLLGQRIPGDRRCECGDRKDGEQHRGPAQPPGEPADRSSAGPRRPRAGWGRMEEAGVHPTGLQNRAVRRRQGCELQERRALQTTTQP